MLNAVVYLSALSVVEAVKSSYKVSGDSADALETYALAYHFDVFVIHNTLSFLSSCSLYFGDSTPGVSEYTICISGVFTIPIIRWRVVCAFEVIMDIRSPTNEFISVDFPTLGFPTIFTNPALCCLFSLTCLLFMRFKFIKKVA